MGEKNSTGGGEKQGGWGRNSGRVGEKCKVDEEERQAAVREKSRADGGEHHGAVGQNIRVRKGLNIFF